MGCGQSNPTLLLQLNKILMQQQICWEAIYQLNPYAQVVGKILKPYYLWC